MIQVFSPVVTRSLAGFRARSVTVGLRAASTIATGTETGSVLMSSEDFDRSRALVFRHPISHARGGNLAENGVRNTLHRWVFGRNRFFAAIRPGQL